jgi:CxxC motif-containing protein (DUF1111 family)
MLRSIFALLAVLPFALAEYDYSRIGDRVNASIQEGVAVTEGVIRVRRRHENDMDFNKYNPFYWEGRHTQFKVEDYTPLGENKLVFTMTTEWPQDATPYRGPDFSAIYQGDPLADETLRSKFAINARMKHSPDFKSFEMELGKVSFGQHPEELKPGQLLTFEFRFFNNESHPDWARQKKRNPHNLSAYYSEFFRIRIGEPGLYIDDIDTPNAFPSPRRYSGGWTTLPTVRVEPWMALQQSAFNLTPENNPLFLTGRTWFHTDFETGKHVGDESDDKPSVFFEDMEAERADIAASAYNARSCNACHRQNGSAFIPLPDALDEKIHKPLIRISVPETGNPHPTLGGQLQTAGADKEGDLQIARFETHEVKLDDGTMVTLSKPIFKVSGPTDALGLSPRTPPALIGMGLLEAVPEKLIHALDERSDGEARMVNGKLGRFGWKAGQPTLTDQIQSALLNDMGVMSEGRMTLDGKSDAGKTALATQAIAELDAYVALLGVPPRNRPEDPMILAGEQIFNQVDCKSCHLPTLLTRSARYPELQNQRIHPYTDLLLHDMGEGLADTGPAALARKWRTAPLWALKNTRDAGQDHLGKFRPGDTQVTFAETHAAARDNRVQLLHDGRARSLTEAILWHGGEAAESVKKYKALSKADREALEAFIWDL